MEIHRLIYQSGAHIILFVCHIICFHIACLDNRTTCMLVSVFYFCHPTKSTYVTYLYIVLLFLLIRLFIFCHCQVLFLAYKYVSLAINFFRCSYLFMFFIFHAFLHLFLVWLLREVQKKIIRRPTYVVFVAVFRIIWCLL